MKIGIDIDDTISETYSTIIPYAQKYTIEELGRSGKTNKVEAKDHMYTTALLGWNKEEEYGFFSKYYEQYISEVDIKHLAKEYLERLDENNEIYLITARFEIENTNIEEITKKWLKDKGVPYKKLIINAQDKVAVAKEYGIDLFIDDSFKNCKAVSESGIKTLIMDSKVNSDFEINNVTRVYSWPQVYQEYEKILKGEQ